MYDKEKLGKIFSDIDRYLNDLKSFGAHPYQPAFHSEHLQIAFEYDAVYYVIL